MIKGLADYYVICTFNVGIMLCNFEFLWRTSIEGSNVNLIGPENKDVFRNLVLICVCVGTLASIIFHMMITIPKHINVSHVQFYFSALNINHKNIFLNLLVLS